MRLSHTAPHPLNAAVEVRGYHHAGPGWVRGLTHERRPRYDIEYSDGSRECNVPGEFVFAPGAAPLVVAIDVVRS